MKDMQSSLNALTRFKVFRYGIRATLLLSPVLYLLLWDTVIRSDVLSIIRLSFRFLSSTLTGEMARVQVSAVPEVVLWKGGWLPVYWSKLGDLTPYHGLFSMVYIIYLGSSVYKHGMKIRIITPAFSNIKSPETVKKFWIVFGVVAFLTTSLSTVTLFAEIVSFIYFLIYLIALPLVPLSLYFWWKRRSAREGNP